MADLLDTHDAPDGVEEARAETSAGIDRRAVPRKKLSIEISADLHRRILVICATRRVPVNQAVREVLERAFPGP